MFHLKLQDIHLKHTLQLCFQDVPLSRSRRWILSWLMGHTSLMEHIQGKEENKDVKPEETRDNKSESSVVVHNLPNAAESIVDLSSDTRVNYLDGQGRTGSLAHEGDAEVFDWELLQKDRDRTAFNVNPHYYEFHDKSEDEEESDNAAYATLYSSPYGVRERTEVGYLRPAFERSSGDSSNVRSFRQTPIAYKDSLEYFNSINKDSGRRTQ